MIGPARSSTVRTALARLLVVMSDTTPSNRPTTSATIAVRV